MFNQVLNLVAGTIGIAASVSVLKFLAFYTFQEPKNFNKDLRQLEEEADKNENN